jgi:hypothetical protein
MPLDILLLILREVTQFRRRPRDLIEEYARHNGHADLIREAIDGAVGE